MMVVLVQRVLRVSYGLKCTLTVILAGSKTGPYHRRVNVGFCIDIAEDAKNCGKTCDTFPELVGIRSVLSVLTLLLERNFS